MVFSLSADQKRYLLAIARSSIAEELGEDTRVPTPPSEPIHDTCGAFVTLKIDGALRGCIGTMTSDNPLPEVIRDMAKSSAFRDPRFPPLAPSEFDDIHIELSILSPMIPIDSPEAVEVGVHGILIRSGYRSGVLLPQVAVERGWDRTTFLEQTCVKAGLPRRAYLGKNIELYVFSAILCDESNT